MFKLLLYTLLLGDPKVDYLTNGVLQIESFKVHFENNITNSSCGLSLSCISNNLIQYGGWFFENDILMFCIDKKVYMWTNLILTNTVMYGINSEGKKIIMRKEK